MRTGNFTWINVLLLLAFNSFGQKEISISELRFINELIVDNSQLVGGTRVGGLSGVDYDPHKDVFYFISDADTARFFRAKLFFSEKGIDSVTFSNVWTLQNSSDYARADAEGIRFNKKTREFVWTSEGERKIEDAKKILVNPSINIASIKGQSTGTFLIPPNLSMQPEERGPRKNGTLEGLTFADNFKTLFVSMEEPLYEDGPRASLSEADPWVRFYQFDAVTKKNVAQYAYKLEPVARQSVPESSFKMNSVSEILALGNQKLLAIERSYSTGHAGCVIKVFIADLKSATDVSHIGSLKENPPAKAITKKLILNMDSLGMYIDNIEGFTFGPDLPNGHKSLIFTSDNNFSKTQKTQLLVFEVIP
jgi:hypothetical protein